MCCIDVFTFSLITGNYPKLIFHFKLKRSILYFILETYVPSSALVVLSWVSFWISQSSVPARICIGGNIMQSLITTLTCDQMDHQNVSTPPQYSAAWWITQMPIDVRLKLHLYICYKKISNTSWNKVSQFSQKTLSSITVLNIDNKNKCFLCNK